MAVIVRLPFCDRPVALPVLAKLVVKGTNSASRLWLARRMTQMRQDRNRPGSRGHLPVVGKWQRHNGEVE
jgi:hypothetical protein